MEHQTMCLAPHGWRVSARGGGPVRNGPRPEAMVLASGMDGGDGFIEIHTR